MSVFLTPDNQASNIGRFASGVYTTTKIPDLYAIKRLRCTKAVFFLFLSDDKRLSVRLLQGRKYALNSDYRAYFLSGRTTRLPTFFVRWR